MGKGSKERMITFGSATKNALFNYLIHFRGEPANPGIDTFFLSTYGFTMTKEGIRSMLRRVGELAGVPRLHPHLCRHTYATNFLINGGNVLLLKQNLGHSSLTMVDRYVHLATSRAALMSKGFSPMDKLNIRGLHRRRNQTGSDRRDEPPVYKQHQKRSKNKNG
jgi:integrase/recombinase XerC/integrase/recombinase XerD